MSELTQLYNTIEDMFMHAREEWEKDHKAGLKRKESYWQGRKDGLRASMNLVYQLIPEEDHVDRILGT